jgi:hypothetical protein
MSLQELAIERIEQLVKITSETQDDEMGVGKIGGTGRMPGPPSDLRRVRFSTSEVSARAIIGVHQQVS